MEIGSSGTGLFFGLLGSSAIFLGKTLSLSSSERACTVIFRGVWSPPTPDQELDGPELLQHGHFRRAIE